MAQAANRFDVWQHPGIQAAARMALEPWSSVEEKLNALTFLIDHPSAECVEVLHQAIFLLGLSRPIHVVDRILGVPKGGEVAGAAARGLAVCAGFGGLKVLEDLILNEGNSRVIRETAAYGLGASAAPETFELYARALNTWDPDVRFRVLLSLRESLDRIVDVETAHVQPVLIQLANVFISRIRDLQGGEHDVAVSILSRYGGAGCEELLGKALLSSVDSIVLRAVVEVLRRKGTRHARLRLMQAFLSSNRPASLYPLIADELSQQCSHDIGVRPAAQNVISSYPFGQWLLSLVSSRERNRRASHVRAALTMVRAV